MEQTTKNKIETCNSLHEYLEVIKKNFDTENCKPSTFITSTLILTISQKLSNQKALEIQKLRADAQKCKNFTEVLNLLRERLEDSQFTPGGRLNLANDTDKICFVLGLKEKVKAEAEPIKKKENLKRFIQCFQT